MSQCNDILRALKRGEKLTPLDALRRFGTIALHSRAAELRARGYKVRCRLVQRGGKRVGEYSL
jgi:hypothetical protein